MEHCPWPPCPSSWFNWLPSLLLSLSASSWESENSTPTSRVRVAWLCATIWSRNMAMGAYDREWDGGTYNIQLEPEPDRGLGCRYPKTGVLKCSTSDRRVFFCRGVISITGEGGGPRGCDRVIGARVVWPSRSAIAFQLIIDFLWFSIKAIDVLLFFVDWFSTGVIHVHIWYLFNII